MIGVGEIYESYRSGDLLEDEAVAVVHGPEDAGFMPLTLPTVEAVATIEALVSRGRIGTDESERLLEAVARTHFSVRTWRGVVEAAIADSATRARILSSLRRGHVERKRLDALTLLDRMVADGEGAAGPRRQTPPPPTTPAFCAALARASKPEAGLA